MRNMSGGCSWRAKWRRNGAIEEKIEGFYIPSFSSRTIVYKGLFNAPQLPKFYPDLKDPLFTTALAIFHQRYSTNTFPNWQLAHPFRCWRTTAKSTRCWQQELDARAGEGIDLEVWKDKVDLLSRSSSRAAPIRPCLDNALEVLELSGRDILHSVMMLAPEAWEKMTDMKPELKGFYKFHACLNEPWDGPAAVVFSDGRFVGATLDRNGLRPARLQDL